jgi:hypothetical protein
VKLFHAYADIHRYPAILILVLILLLAKTFFPFSRRYHPDKNQGKEEQAKQAFTAITAAYHVLSTANFDFERRVLPVSYTFPSHQLAAALLW